MISPVNIFNNTVSDNFKERNEYIQIHQIRVYANCNSKINLVPEGIHQDGFNMIAICCISRVNIKGGVSNIYDENKKLVYSSILKEGEFIIVNDNKYYHDVSEIELDDLNKIGYRDIIVLTTIS